MTAVCKRLLTAALCSAAVLLWWKAGYCRDAQHSRALRHYIMGTLYDDLGDIDAAIGEYRKALKTDKTAALIRLNLSAALIKKDDLAGAIQELKKAIELDPSAVEPHAILALIYTSQSKADLAAQEYEQALLKAAKQSPENPEIQKNLGMLYAQQKRYAEAEQAFRIIVAASPEDAEAHFILASVLYQMKKQEDTEAHLRKVIELQPDSHQALNFLGYLFAETGRNLDEAHTLISRALALDPQNGAYLDSLGWVYFKKGEYEKALSELKKAVALIDDPVVYEHLGDVYRQLNDTGAAALNWKKSLELDATQEAVRRKLQAL
jgi:tetratricopeptide (TPR) repeat protein